MTGLEELGEFGLISRLAKKLSPLPKGVLGIGDDCAVVPKDSKHDWLLSADTLVEGTHFLMDRISPKDLGHKVCAVNLSDIAAMGGTPRFCLLNLSLPKGLELEWIDEFFSGFQALAEKHGALLIGGDTTGSQHGLFVNVTVIGEVAKGQAMLRSTAQEDDLLCLTHPLGASSAGLHCVLNGQDIPELIQAHYRPEPAIEEGQWLAEQPGVHALMDLSDGLYSDLQRLREASQCDVSLDLRALPIDERVTRHAPELALSAEEVALFGGEDYGLLFSVDKNSLTTLSADFGERFGRPLVPIGKVTAPGQGEPQLDTMANKGFLHF